MAKQPEIESSRSFDQFKARFFPHLIQVEDRPTGRIAGEELGVCRATKAVDKLLKESRRRSS